MPPYTFRLVNVFDESTFGGGPNADGGGGDAPGFNDLDGGDTPGKDSGTIPVIDDSATGPTVLLTANPIAPVEIP